MTDTIEVHVDVRGVSVRVGTASFLLLRSGSTTTLTYDREWLRNPRAFALDPRLPLTFGQHVVEGVPGAFTDAAPGQWGRGVLERRSRATTRLTQAAHRSPHEVDLLLGVSDATRLGGLRFRIEGEDRFLATDHDSPTLADLPRLLLAAEAVTRGDDDAETVDRLLDAGAGSLGGSRPKVAVRADDGRLLVAKLPHHRDHWDVAAWEKTALDLAERAGIPVPGRRLVRIDPGTTLLLDRFDRTRSGGRIPYLSGLSLVSGRDGDAFDYQDVAAHLEESGAGDGTELASLFRRVVLNVAVHNTDDHLRNLGLLRSPDGWRLSPAFDVNPNPDLGARRQTSIGTAESVGDEPDGLLRLAEWCHLRPADARRVIDDVLDATAAWRLVAMENHASLHEIGRFTDVFEQQRAALRRLTAAPVPAATPPTASDRSQPRHPSGTSQGGEFGAKPNVGHPSGPGGSH